MGCDIHMQVEVLRDGKWSRVDELPPRPCSWCDGKVICTRDDGSTYPCFDCNGKYAVNKTPGLTVRSYKDRNYTVFSVLANVRNDGYVKPISEPRGLPSDTDKRQSDDDEWVFGDHSFSYLKLDEVLAYNWKQVIKDEGWVSAAEFAEWDANGATGAPRSWSGGVGGGSVDHVSNSEMRERIARKRAGTEWSWQSSRSPYTLIQWTVVLADYCESFLQFVNSLAPLGEPSNVRLVFGFDS